MSWGLVSVIISCVGWVIAILVQAFGGGKKYGEAVKEISNLRQDIQDLHEIISTNNDLHNDNYQEQRDLVYKIKAAVEAFTGKTINGVSYRRRD